MSFMRKMQTMRSLSFRQLLFFPIIFILLGIARIIILTIPFRVITRIFLESRNKKYLFTTRKMKVIMDLAKSITIAAKYTPWASKCLVQALIIRLFLRIYSLPNIFYIGISYDKDDKFLSHAWISVEDITVIGGQNSFLNFKIIKQFEDK